jgi:hypothetical protein
MNGSCTVSDILPSLDEKRIIIIFSALAGVSDLSKLKEEMNKGDFRYSYVVESPHLKNGGTPAFF